MQKRGVHRHNVKAGVLTHGAEAVCLQVVRTNRAGCPALGHTHVSTDTDCVKHVVFGINSFPCVTEKEEKPFVTVSDLPIIKLLSSLTFKPHLLKTPTIPSTRNTRVNYGEADEGPEQKPLSTALLCFPPPGSHLKTQRSSKFFKFSCSLKNTNPGK